MTRGLPTTGLVLVLTVVLAFGLTSAPGIAAGDITVQPGVTFESDGGTTITVTEQLDLDSPFSYPDDETVDLSPNATFSSSGNTNATVESIDGEWTNLTTHDVDPALTVNPTDKQAVSIQGTNVQSVNFSAVDTKTRDQADIVFSSSSSVSITVNGLPADRDIEVFDLDTGSKIATETTDNSGTVTFSFNSGTDRHIALASASTPALSNLDIAGQGSDATITEGEDDSIQVTVENIGTGSSSFTVSLDLGSGTPTRDTKTPQLSGGESDTTIYSEITGGLGTGDYNVTLTSGRDSISGTLTVTEATPKPNFGVSLGNVTDPVPAGETVTVPYTVENTGNAGDTQTVSLQVNGTQQDSQSLQLDSGASTSGEFTYTTDTDDTPEIDISVESNNDTASTQVTVIDAPQFADAVVTDGSPNVVDLTFDSTVTLDGTEPTNRFTVQVDGSTVALEEAFVSNGSVLLKLPESITANQTVTISYDGDSNTVQGPAGVGAAAFSDESVTNDVEPASGVTAVVSASSYVVSPTTQVDLRATESELNNAADPSYEWTIDGDQQSDDQETLTTAFSETGEIPIELTVSADGTSDTAETTVRVRDQTAPTARLAASDTIDVGGDPGFDASASQDNVEIASYEWTFGDGTTAQGTTPAHTYDEPGRYDVTLTVTDTSGNTARNSTTVLVEGPVADLSSETLAFGNVSTNSTASDAVTLANAGTTDLLVETVSVTGQDGDGYAVGTETGFAVRPGENSSVPVTFSPDTTGSYEEATLVIETNNPDPGTFEVALGGTGTESSLTPPNSSIEMAPTAVGENTTTDVTIENTGGDGTQITELTLAGGAADQFAVDAALPIDLPAGTTEQIPVTHAPTAPGNHTATLVVTTADGDTAQISLSATATGPDIHLDTNRLSVGKVAVDETDTATLPVSNYGSAPLDISDVSLDGTTPFSIESAPETVGVDETGEITVSFSPTADGSSEGTITIESDDPETPTVDATVTGEGVGADIGVGQSTLDFGTTQVGESVSVTLTVTNSESSPADLTVSDSDIVGKHPGDYAIEAGGAPFTLAPGESQEVELRFTAQEPGDREAQLKLRSNAGNQPLINVWLSNTDSYILVEDKGAQQQAPTVGIEGANLQRGNVHVANVLTPSADNEPVSMEKLTIALGDSGGFTLDATYTRGSAETAGGPETAGTAGTASSQCDSCATAAASTPTAGPLVENYEPGENREVLRYVEFEGENTGLFAERTIEFTVNRSSLPSGTQPSAIEVYSYNESAGSYEQRETTLLETTSEAYRFETTIAAFSTLAVTVPTESGDTERIVFSIQDTTTEQDGEQVTTTATIENTGSASGEQIIEFRSGSKLVPYTDDQRIVQLQGLQDVVRDWRRDERETDVLQEAVTAWRRGTSLESTVLDGKPLELAPGENRTVQFTYANETATQPGQQLLVATADDDATVTLPETPEGLRDVARPVGLGLVAE